jgi:hypothetical protein
VSEVTETATGFAVSVRSRDPGVVTEIERRARLFADAGRAGSSSAP